MVDIHTYPNRTPVTQTTDKPDIDQGWPAAAPVTAGTD